MSDSEGREQNEETELKGDVESPVSDDDSLGSVREGRKTLEEAREDAKKDFEEERDKILESITAKEAYADRAERSMAAWVEQEGELFELVSAPRQGR